jgi:hypothetical protein
MCSSIDSGGGRSPSCSLPCALLHSSTQHVLCRGLNERIRTSHHLAALQCWHMLVRMLLSTSLCTASVVCLAGLSTSASARPPALLSCTSVTCLSAAVTC